MRISWSKSMSQYIEISYKYMHVQSISTCIKLKGIQLFQF